MSAWLMMGDCLEQLRLVPDGTVDAVVTDPPYGLSFMGKKWDYDVPGVDVWAECLRVLKPGGHLLAFAGTRTQHRMAVRIEDAGFEIRDMIAWIYGSGFPKSLDVSKAIDKAAGAEREVVGKGVSGSTAGMQSLGPSGIKGGEYDITAPATDAARQWQGWGTALKPALEPITVARKPLAGTVAENVQQFGTGALNIDGCRVGMMTAAEVARSGTSTKAEGWGMKPKSWKDSGKEPQGRFPANLIHDGSPEVLAGFPDSASGKPNPLLKRHPSNGVTYGDRGGQPEVAYEGAGSAARFFYCAKASKSDRDAGLAELEEKEAGIKNGSGRGSSAGDPYAQVMRKNNHPTVKPTDLMRYLCRLVTPPGGVVLDPFMGSGSTGRAARLEGFQFIGVERDPAYFEIAQRRVNAGL